MTFDAEMMTSSGLGETTAALVRRAQDMRELAIPQRLGESASIEELRIFASAAADWFERARDLEVPIDSGEAGLEEAAQEIEAELSRTRPNHFTAQGAEIVHSPTGIGLVVRPSAPAAGEEGVGPEPGVFPVYAKMTTGDDGDASNTCSFLYSVYALDKETLLIKNSEGDTAMGMTPEKSRIVNIKYTTPDGELHRALAYHDEDGDLVLWDANEFPFDPEEC